jgi:hypothetical protein
MGVAGRVLEHLSATGYGQPLEALANKRVRPRPVHLSSRFEPASPSIASRRPRPLLRGRSRRAVRRFGDCRNGRNPGVPGAAVLALIASPLWTKQERGVARGPVENEMQSDVLRGGAGSRLCECRARRWPEQGPHEWTPKRPRRSRGPGRRGLPENLPGRCNCRSDLLFARTRVNYIGNQWCLESVPDAAGDRHPGCAR